MYPMDGLTTIHTSHTRAAHIPRTAKYFSTRNVLCYVAVDAFSFHSVLALWGDGAIAQCDKFWGVPMSELIFCLPPTINHIDPTAPLVVHNGDATPTAIIDAIDYVHPAAPTVVDYMDSAAVVHPIDYVDSTPSIAHGIHHMDFPTASPKVYAVNDIYLATLKCKENKLI
uniref:SFRICE_031159 n=1 Tax=Spodoptera frugiperda TaxID=7108 RepID=A0A2H1VU50_SPOFR